MCISVFFLVSRKCHFFLAFSGFFSNYKACNIAHNSKNKPLHTKLSWNIFYEYIFWENNFKGEWEASNPDIFWFNFCSVWKMKSWLKETILMFSSKLLNLKNLIRYFGRAIFHWLWAKRRSHWLQNWLIGGHFYFKIQMGVAGSIFEPNTLNFGNQPSFWSL